MNDKVNIQEKLQLFDAYWYSGPHTSDNSTAEISFGQSPSKYFTKPFKKKGLRYFLWVPTWYNTAD